ncbi:MAG: hypothetical protein K8S13_21680 [Desulfobacula sp.]|uniref:hypothetical protein n=1 Tax=Desulfobacula sp. TaxID=2593537 RepID=UPI0025BA4210|nr:hypothetical protein [Desulfobacula sp.]MCD4722443.1 hypothetical protein [Desulfobacula sp.]
MKNFSNLSVVNDKILKIKQLLTELEAEAEQFPALSRNSKRALASIKMLELNISDIVALE